MTIDVLLRGKQPFPDSLPEFQRPFPDEAACATYLERIRWSDGFTCSHCGFSGEPYRITTRLMLSVPCLASQAISQRRPMPNFILANYGLLYLVGVCDNRISTVHLKLLSAD